MFKRILVPTDGSETARLGERYAIALARHMDATVVGLHVVDVKLLEGPFLRDLSASLGAAPYVNYQGNIALLLDERGKAALVAFQEACDSAHVACHTELVTGAVPRTIVEQGRLTDLIVMGRGGEHNQWLEGLAGSTTEAVARRSSQPVLVTAQDTPGKTRFLVAYDGSAFAKQALKTAVGIAKEWEMPFHVISVGETEERSVVTEAMEYLKAHKLDVEYVQRTGEPAETIVRYAKDCAADLLVMGAYGHSKVRELVVGSTTAYAINRAPCPVLLVR